MAFGDMQNEALLKTSFKVHGAGAIGKGLQR